MSNEVDRNLIGIRAQSAWLEALRLHEDPETLGTPERVWHFWQEKLVSGYQCSPTEALGPPLQTQTDALVCIESIPFHSMCPHHLVPYFGTVDICYDPADMILGLGRFEPFIQVCSRRLILQEALTEQIGETLEGHLSPKGALVRLKATHLCQMLNGQEPRGSSMTTLWSCGTLKNRYEILTSKMSVTEMSK